MNIIILEPPDLDASGRIHLEDLRAKHIRDVLEKAIGDSIKVGLLNGPLGQATLEEQTDGSVTMSVTWQDAPERPSTHVVLACPRPKVLQRLWSQLTTMGVDRIDIISAAKVERCYFGSHAVEESRYRPLLIEGLQQAGCTHLPEVHIHRIFKAFVEKQFGADEGPDRYLLHPNRGAPLPTLLAESDQAEGVTLAIGPEGGWSDFELEFLELNGFEPASLGRRILRSDTACTVALGIVNACQVP